MTWSVQWFYCSSTGTRNVRREPRGARGAARHPGVGSFARSRTVRTRRREGGVREESVTDRGRRACGAGGEPSLFQGGGVEVALPGQQDCRRQGREHRKVAKVAGLRGWSY